MSKYISIFFLTILISVILFFILAAFFTGEGDPAEEVVYLFGIITVILLSFVIGQLYYLIDLIKKKR